MKKTYISFIKINILIFITLFLMSCGTKKRVVASQQPPVVVNEPKSEPIVESEPKMPTEIVSENPNLNNKTLQYIHKFAPIAISEMYAHKIPASITLAQGILESGNGFSDLATRSNNHFGIKCHRGWQGEKVYHDDDERDECFRKYQHPDTSYQDHSLFLTQRKRYADLFTLDITDYKGWAKGLRKAGYATDKRYPQKLINLIERYQLYKFDNQANNHISNSKITNTTPITYIVKKGDTLYSISRKYKVSVASLKKLNNINDNNISIGQNLLIK